MSRAPIENKKAVLSWCLFDFGNSSFTTVIITAVFNVYFVKTLAPGDDGTRLWSIAVLVSNLIVILTAPVIGAIADFSGKKKFYLGLSFATCVVFTACLSLIHPDISYAVPLALTFVVLANTAFASGENLISAFLPEIASPRDISRVSAWGWGIGYIGGLASLGLCLLAMSIFGKETGARLCGVIVALFFLIGGMPTFLFVPEKKRDTVVPLGQAIRAGMKESTNTVKSRDKLPDLFQFFFAALVLQIGIYGVIQYAGIYGVKLAGMDQDEVTQALLAAQIPAALGAMSSGFFAAKMGTTNTVRMFCIVWALAGALLLLWSTPTGFWCAALLAGFSMGTSLATIRSTVALFTPAGRGGEIFGFWGLFGRIAAILAPAGNLALLAITNDSLKAGIAYFLGCFVVAFFLLASVDEKRGRETAAAMSHSN